MAKAQAGGAGDGSSGTSRCKGQALKRTMGEPSPTPCGACKFLRKKCHSGCIFAPFFGTDQGSARFEIVHKVFGASNMSKLLMRIPENKRNEAMATISYEAKARLIDPVYGCLSTIFALKQQVLLLQEELAMVQNQVKNNRFVYTNVLQNAQQQQEQEQQQQQQQPNINATMQPAHSSFASTNLMNMSSFNPRFDSAVESAPSSHSFESLLQFSQFFRDEEDGEEQSIIPLSSQP